MRFTPLALFLAFLLALSGVTSVGAQSLPAHPLGDSLAITPVSGPQSLLVIGCYFSDTPDTGQLGVAMDGIKRMYGPVTQRPSVANYFDHVSNSRISIQSSVMSWYPLPHDEAYYARDDAGREAQRLDCQDKVKQVVSNVADYRVVVMLFNYDTGMSNQARTYGAHSWVYLRPWGGHGGWSNLSTHVHELGHAFGLPHSHNSDAPNENYQNEFDPMSGFDEGTESFFFWNATGWCNGYAGIDPKYFSLAKCTYENTDGPRHLPVFYSAYQRVRLGWLSDSPQNTEMFYGGEQSYRLDALGVPTYNQKHTEMIAIPEIGSRSFYTAELRLKSADYYEQGLTREAVVVYYVDPTLVSVDSGDGTRVAVLGAGEKYTSPSGVEIQVSGADLAQITVRGPKPYAVLSSLEPDYASSLRNSPPGVLPVTVKGAGFAPSTVMVWPGFGMLSGMVAGTGYTDSGTIKLGVPDSLLRQGRSTILYAIDDRDNNPTAPRRQLAFWVSPSGAATTSSTLANSASSPTSASSGKLSLTAQGTGTLAATTFTSNPGTNAQFASADRWFGALSGAGNTFSRIDVIQCDANGGTGLRWWDAGNWQPVTPAAALDAAGCLRFSATGTSKPSLANVASGALFAIGRDMRLAPITNPVPVDEGSPLSLSGVIVNPSTDNMGLKVEWSDGNTDTQPLAANSAQFTLTHVYRDNPRGSGAKGIYPVHVSLLDANGTVVSTTDTSAMVRNVAPTVELTTYVQSITPNAPLDLYIHLKDPGVAGTEGDTLNATIDWGDGSVDRQAVPAAQVGFAAQHSYQDRPGGGLGLFTIAVTLTDDDGGSGTATTPITVTFGVAASQVLACQDLNYGGACLIVRNDWPDLRTIGSFNDQVSSIKITGPTRIAAYSDINYQGRCETFTASDASLADNAIGNDTISSIRLGVSCP